MQFSAKRDVLLKSLNLVQGIIERKNTLPILSNVLLEVKDKKLKIIATDLDLIFYDEIQNIEIQKEGSTTTSANILYDILRKISPESLIKFDLKTENKLNLKTNNSNFNLNCLPTDNFPNFSDNFTGNEIKLEKNKFLSLLNKSKISISNDDTRHYLNGIFLHLTSSDSKSYLTGVATDSHRLSSSSIEMEQNLNFSSIILPKKTVFQLCTLLLESEDDINMTSSDNKIQFQIGKTKLISKVIDGKFPDYKKVVPTKNDKVLLVKSKEFINSIERVITVSIDKKEGVKLDISKDNIKFSVNSANSGEGNEVTSAKYSGNDLAISFNSKYLLEIASVVEDSELKINFKDPMSPVLIEDKADKNSFYVIMPMKI
tara:strand:- start:471 stop:1586 length:1116 start_codon:yes stop_codon:yes gene_type:complete